MNLKKFQYTGKLVFINDYKSFIQIDNKYIMIGNNTTITSELSRLQ